MANKIGRGWETMALDEIGSGWRFLFGVCGWWSSWGLAFTMKVGMLGFDFEQCVPKGLALKGGGGPKVGKV